MPSAKVLRRVSDNTLIAFGPDTPDYVPRVPVGAALTIEPDYDAVVAEWLACQSTPAQIDATADSRFDLMEKTEKAILLVVRSYCNALLAGTYTNKSISNVKADFVAAFKTLP